MCFYDQYRFSCGDWKWGNFRQHCVEGSPIGESCGIKLVMTTIQLEQECGSCQKIETRQRRQARESERISSWSAANTHHLRVAAGSSPREILLPSSGGFSPAWHPTEFASAPNSQQDRGGPLVLSPLQRPSRVNRAPETTSTDTDLQSNLDELAPKLQNTETCMASTQLAEAAEELSMTRRDVVVAKRKREPDSDNEIGRSSKRLLLNSPTSSGPSIDPSIDPAANPYYEYPYSIPSVRDLGLIDEPACEPLVTRSVEVRSPVELPRRAHRSLQGIYRPYSDGTTLTPFYEEITLALADAPESYEVLVPAEGVLNRVNQPPESLSSRGHVQVFSPASREDESEEKDRKSMRRKSMRGSYACPDCMKLFTRYTNLQRHVESTHNWRNGSLYICPIPDSGRCDRRFKRRDNLLGHLRRVHGLPKESAERTLLLAREESQRRDQMSYREDQIHDQKDQIRDREEKSIHPPTTVGKLRSEGFPQRKNQPESVPGYQDESLGRYITLTENLEEDRPKAQKAQYIECWRCFLWHAGPEDLCLRCQEQLSTWERSNFLVDDNAERQLSDPETLDSKQSLSSTKVTRNDPARLEVPKRDPRLDPNDDSANFDLKEQPQSAVGAVSSPTTPTRLVVQPEVPLMSTEVDSEAPGKAPRAVAVYESPFECTDLSCEPHSGVQDIVEPAVRDTSGIQVMRSIAQALKLKEPALGTGKTRIRWTCHCGKRLYDDFKELRPGAAKELEQSLDAHANTREKANSSPESGGRFAGIASNLSSLLGSIRRWATSGNGPSLPQYQMQNRPDQAPQTTSQPLRDSLYLLLCIPHKKRATKLLHLDVCTVMSDQLLFRLLKENYHEIRGRWSSRLSLKALKTIKFVQFEMYKSELVDIRKVDDIPPGSRVKEYRYRPMPPDLIPPVGENHLMHLYDHPHDAEDTATCLAKFPKKLRERLLVCPSRGTGLGWGIHFVEGWHLSKIWLLAFSLFVLGSLVFGVCWAVLKDDFQGAFGVSAYIIAFLALSVVTVQAAFELK